MSAFSYTDSLIPVYATGVFLQSNNTMHIQLFVTCIKNGNIFTEVLIGFILFLVLKHFNGLSSHSYRNALLKKNVLSVTQPQ